MKRGLPVESDIPERRMLREESGGGKTKIPYVIGLYRTLWWSPGRDSNSHGFTRRILNPLRLPFRHPGTEKRNFISSPLKMQ